MLVLMLVLMLLSTLLLRGPSREHCGRRGCQLHLFRSTQQHLESVRSHVGLGQGQPRQPTWRSAQGPGHGNGLAT